MKTKLLLLVVCLLFVFSCDTKEAKQESDFVKDLLELSEINFNLFISTRSEDSVVNEDELNWMLDLAGNMSAKYGLVDEIGASDYYEYIREFNPSKEEFGAMSAEEIIKLLEMNATPQCVSLLMEIVEEEQCIDNSVIIRNDDLLPNEQVGLVLINNIVNQPQVDQLTTRSCLEAYNAGMSGCRKRLVYKMALSVVCTAVNGFLGAVMAGATAIDHDTCTSNVMAAYMAC
jgi:hypothetical protein